MKQHYRYEYPVVTEVPIARQPNDGDNFIESLSPPVLRLAKALVESEINTPDNVVQLDDYRYITGGYAA
jgi:hypothetical protein